MLFSSNTKYFVSVLLKNRFKATIYLCSSLGGLSARKPAENMANTQNLIYRRIDNITKSAEDKRNYRGLELVNHMKILLVSDPTTDKSAAAMDVNVGYLCDPDNVPGLAHFCEHMLFLGTEKYPNENDYNKFLSQNGGGSNAATYPDHTNYFFDIVPDHLRDALDRFAQFFLAPLFTENATERELNAVNSEHEKNIPSDLWRMDQLDKHTANPTHPYHKFGTGNKKTLEILPKEKGINVRDELLKFHNKWYSSNIMALAVLGKESLDELEEMVVPLFSGVQNKEVVAPRWEEHPFKPEQLRTCAYVFPVKDVRNLNIVFPSPDLHEFYKASPGNYISHLVGHEGPGSILSLLKSKGWSNNLIAGNRPSPRGFGFFGVSVDLTEEGMNHIDDIIELVFQYLNMLRQVEPLEWVQEEQRDIATMVFRFKDKESPRGYISNVVHNIHEYPMEDILYASYMFSDWRPDLIKKLLKDFIPENIRIAVIAKQFENDTDAVEPWYGTKYKLVNIPKQTLTKWNNSGTCDELRIPDKNDFIPTNFDLYTIEKGAHEHPTIIQDTALTRVWFKQDDKFLLPKANLLFDFVSPLAYLDPLNCNLTHMLVQLFRDSLSEYAYAAELAGLKWDLSSTKYGLILAIGGYNNKQHILLNKIMEKLANFKVDPKRFAIFKENYIRALKNFAAEQPYQHAVYYLTVLLSEHSWTKEELLDATEQVTIERLEAFIPQILSKIHIECLLHGNVNKQKALDLVHIVQDHLSSAVNLSPLLPRQLLLNRELKLEDGCNYVYEVQNKVHKSSSIELFYQCGIQNKENNMKLELFSQIIQEPCFNNLRTTEQLGYIVFSGIRRANGVQGLRVIVQSEKHPSYLDERIESFFMNMFKTIEDMPEKEFNKHKEALAAHRLEKPKQLGAQSQLYWSEITTQQYHFDRANVEVAYLRTLTKADVLEFCKELLQENANRRKKISVYVLSMAEGGAGNIIEKEYSKTSVSVKTPQPRLIEDVTAFKSSHEMYPLVQPYINITRKGNKSKL